MQKQAGIGLIALCMAACGSTGTFRNGVFDNGVTRFRVGPLTAGFERVEVADNDLSFHRPKLGTISVNATCTEYEDVPQTALLNQLLFGTTQREFLVDETVTLDGRGARHVISDLELDGVPMRINVYLLQKDGCVYDLTHVGSRQESVTAQPVFDAFVRGFAVLRTRLPD
jgi:hypothetical protein